MLADDLASKLLNALQGRDVLLRVGIPRCAAVLQFGKNYRRVNFAADSGEKDTWREGYMADGVHKYDEEKWPENRSLRNSRSYMGAVGGEAIKNQSLTPAREVVGKPPQEGTSYADVLK